MRKLSASAGLGLGRSGTEPLKLGLGGGGKESALKAVVKQLEETLKAKDPTARATYALQPLAVVDEI